MAALRALWPFVTYLRHRSELWALGVARQAPFLALFPIFAVVCFWWCIVPLPIVLPVLGLVSHMNLTPGFAAGFALLSLIPGYVLMVWAGPWFFGWYFVAVSMMFGRHRLADAKEQFLEEHLRNYRQH